MIAEKLRQAVLQAAISGQLTTQRPEDGTAAELLERIAAERAQLVTEGKLKKQKPLPPIDEASVPFEIPASWAWVRLGDLATYIQRGKSPKYTDNSPYYAISQKYIQWSGFNPRRSRPYLDIAF